MPSKQAAMDPDMKLNKTFTDIMNSVKHPEMYIRHQPDKEEIFKRSTKCIYDGFNDEEFDPNVLPELILDGMDEEQIWQQIELRNNQKLKTFVGTISHILSQNVDLSAIVCFPTNDPDPKGIVDRDKDEVDENSLASEEPSDTDESSGNTQNVFLEKKKKSVPRSNKTAKESVVDDDFFRLNEMEEFLNAEDNKEMLKQKGKSVQPGDIDYFNDEESDEENDGLKYSDFFGNEHERGTLKREQKSNKRKQSDESASGSDSEEEETDGGDDDDGNENRNDGENNLENKISEQSSEGDEENSDDNMPKSTFEERQERLRQRIKDHEEKALGEKPWQLKGEITAGTRPKNSLLEEILEFDSTTRPAPVITEETTLRLEDIIRQRIKDKAWDDVERKYKPIQTPQELRKKLVLDQEKSKESLAQVYEKEYRNQIEKLNPNQTDEKDDEPESHKEIKKLMKSVFAKLDALSNFHYTPKPAIPELRIITNTPAVEVEEVAPVAVSTAKLLAPEEVRDRAKGGVLGKSERDRTDKNRERRKKKLKQKALGKMKEQRLETKQKMGVPLTTKEEKSKLMKGVLKHRNVQKMSTNGVEGSAPKSSKAFFTQLQDQVSTGKDVKVKKKASKEQAPAKKLKL